SRNVEAEGVGATHKISLAPQLLGLYQATQVSARRLHPTHDGLYENRSLISRLPGVKPQAFVEIDGTMYYAKRTNVGGVQLASPQNRAASGPDVVRLGGKWVAQFRVGVTLEGRAVTLSRSEQYPNSYSVNGNSRFLIHAGNVNVSDGQAVVKSSQCAAFFEAYDKWMNDELDLYRGIATNHFSVNDMRQFGVLKSEGDADIPTFTMGNDDKQKTAWLPTDPRVAIPVAIAVGNQSWLSGVDESIPRGIVIKIRAGANETHFGVSFINSGELAVQGPLTNNEFSIAGIAFVNQREGIVLKSPTEPLSFNDLPIPGPYPDPDGARWTHQQVMGWREEMRQWNAAFARKNLTTVWPPATT
ncbi:hypothetical protein, partial [Burkholderia oklahomensis]